MRALDLVLQLITPPDRIEPGTAASGQVAGLDWMPAEAFPKAVLSEVPPGALDGLIFTRQTSGIGAGELLAGDLLKSWTDSPANNQPPGSPAAVLPPAKVPSQRGTSQTGRGLLPDFLQPLLIFILGSGIAVIGRNGRSRFT
jgi:hypothetical protein